MARLARIALFPVKSMPALHVGSARLLRSGALAGDCVLGLFDAAGKFVNGKRTKAIHTLRLSFDATSRTVELARADDGRLLSLHLDHEREAVHD